ncbi:MAG: hypothetical protein CVU87_08115 [Firmicutes bacterium HGW-Firmicutes-12]|nr:MAG: hypothetical protein CVU87_08115 [Firmicutes bacterium HGW-Firmicutes-12]
MRYCGINFVTAVIWEVLRGIKPDEVGKYLSDLLKVILCSNRPSQEILRIAESTLKNGYINRFMDVGAIELKKIAKNDSLTDLIFEMTERAIERYSQDRGLREFFSSGFRKKVYSTGLQRVQEFLDEFASNPSHEGRINILKKIKKTIEEYKDEKKSQDIDKMIVDFFEEGMVAKAITSEIDRLKNDDFASEASLKKEIVAFAQQFLSKLEKDRDLREQINTWLISKLSDVTEKYHTKIGVFLEKNLYEMSESELVSFVRENTEKDLQMIRINGMVFGVVVFLSIYGIRGILGLI